MATYYRWRKSTIKYASVNAGEITSTTGSSFYTLGTYVEPYFDENTGYYDFSNANRVSLNGSSKFFTLLCLSKTNENVTEFYKFRSGSTSYTYENGTITFLQPGTIWRSTPTAGVSSGYVYSTSSSAYPNGGVSGSYYYDQRTTISSPTAPGSLSYPSPITTPSVTVSWGSSSTNVPSYGVSAYEVSYSANGGSSWTVAGTTSATSMSVTLPVGTTSVQFRVRAKDSNGQWGSYTTGSAVSVLLAPTLTAPSLAMQGQDITLNWTAIEGATSYTLQRKADTDADWVEVYSGTALTFTEAVGTWTSVQYRVQADFDGVTGDWATSAGIPAISASALVISGQNGDLGTLVNDVPYTISTDTGNQITVRTTVNGAVILEGTVPSGTAERIPVLDLIHGTGTIVIEASVETGSGTVSAARSWTYNKAAMTFPNAGSPAQLTKEGENIWPKTLAECVRLPGGRTLEEVMGFPCQVYVGRYTGTGTYGSGNPNEVTVPFKPQAVFVSSGSVGTTIPMIRPCTSAKNGSATLTVTWEDDGVSWYSTSAANQLNAAGTTYDIVAFG